MFSPVDLNITQKRILHDPGSKTRAILANSCGCAVAGTAMIQNARQTQQHVTNEIRISRTQLIEMLYKSLVPRKFKKKTSEIRPRYYAVSLPCRYVGDLILRWQCLCTPTCKAAITWRARSLTDTSQWHDSIICDMTHWHVTWLILSRHVKVTWRTRHIMHMS